MEPSDLVAAIQERGQMTQKQIAEACVCAQSTISDIAKGKNKSPSYQIVKKLEALVAALPAQAETTAESDTQAREISPSAVSQWPEELTKDQVVRVQAAPYRKAHQCSDAGTVNRQEESHG